MKKNLRIVILRSTIWIAWILTFSEIRDSDHSGPVCLLRLSMQGLMVDVSVSHVTPELAGWQWLAVWICGGWEMGSFKILHRCWKDVKGALGSCRSHGKRSQDISRVLWRK